MELGKTQVKEIGAIGSGDRKAEGSCVGDAMLVNYFCVCFGGSGYISPLVE